MSTHPATRPAIVPPTGRPTHPPIEFAFELATSGNPFDFRENDVRVTLASGNARVDLPAFFDGGTTWRVRHTPTNGGDHRVERVTLNGRAVDVEAVQTWGVDAEGTGPGFVRLAVDGMGFVHDDGTPFYPVGYNLGWHHRGQPDMPPLVDSIARMGGHRVNWTRIWMNHWDTKNLDWVEEPGIEQPPLGHYSLVAARRWDAILRAAEQNGVHLQMVLQHHGQYSKTVNPNWDVNPWNANSGVEGGFLEEPADFFTNERARQLTRQKYRYIIARYGYSPSIMAWELFNEVQYTQGFRQHPRQRVAVADWHDEMAAFLREHDDTYRHLITTSSVLEVPSLWRSMDYYQGHVYPPDVLSAIGGIDRRGLDRAYFFGEIGGDAFNEDPAQMKRIVRETLWGGLMTGAAGSAQYWYWYLVEPLGALIQYRVFQDFLDEAGVTNPRHLDRLSVGVDTGTLGPMTLGPGGGWEPSLDTSFTLSSDDRFALGGMSAYLQGNITRDMFPHAELAVDFREAGTFRLKVDGVGRRGADLRVELDGTQVASFALSQPAPAHEDAGPLQLTGSIEFPVPAGEHVVRLENFGDDWIRIRSITLDPYAPELGVLAKGNQSLVMIWAFNRRASVSEAESRTVGAGSTSAPPQATLTIPGRPQGPHEVIWINTRDGSELGRELASPDAKGVLTISTPPVREDAAAIVRRRD